MDGLWDIRRLTQIPGLDVFTLLLGEMQEDATISIPAPNVDLAMTLTAETEEDTFRILSRASVPEMLRHYEDWIIDGNGTMEGLDEMCARYGWTWPDFSVAGAAYRDRNVL